MYNIRTDLATERRELHGEGASGVQSESIKNGNVTTEKTVIKSKSAAERLGLPQGRYFSVLFDDPHLKADFDDITKTVADCLETLFESAPQSVLIIGLGNRSVAPDSLGALTCDRICATRHLASHPLFSLFCSKKCRISVVSAGVLSETGIDSAEMAQAIIGQIKPDAAIIIDALAARKSERLCRTIQLNDTGITPASGYGGDRPAIDRNLLQIPVIGIGIPTVIDSRTYRTQFGGTDDDDGLILTPTDIGKLVVRCAELLSSGVNRYFGTNI